MRNYSAEEVMQYVSEMEVKFIRLAFCDIFGRQKNIAILPSELPKAFSTGIAFDASAIAGFGGAVRSDLFLHPDPTTLVALPWRPEIGSVVRMFCQVTYPDGTPLPSDSRAILKKAVAEAEAKGYSFAFGSEMEFYLFQTDEHGNPTKEPYDRAGYMDIAPADKGENVRREVCLMLEQMGIQPESSHHEEGHGQNEVDFRYSDPVTAADNAVTFCAVVRTVADRNGLCADFSPKPLPDQPGSGMHINFSVKSKDGRDVIPYVIAGIMQKIPDITLFLNPCHNSYDRLGGNKAPGYISWSSENRSQLIRIPAAPAPEYARIEVRMPDVSCNPYLAFALLLAAGFEGMERKMELAEETPYDLYTANAGALEALPASLEEAIARAGGSAFVEKVLSADTARKYLALKQAEQNRWFAARDKEKYQDEAYFGVL